MPNYDSCIVRHFGYYYDVDPEDAALLNSLERSPFDVKAECLVWSEHDHTRCFYTVNAGWLFSFRDLPDGSRQVLDVFLPGDIIGMRGFAFRHHLTSVMTLTDSVVCAFPTARLVEVFHASPSLTTAFFAIAARERALLVERLINLGRRSARARLAHFLAEIYMRLKRTNPNLGNGFRMPVPQHILADILGLSAVHVSRTFRELREDGVVLRERSMVKVPDFDRLAEEGGFAATYLNQDVRELLQGVSPKMPAPAQRRRGPTDRRRERSA